MAFIKRTTEGGHACASRNTLLTDIANMRRWDKAEHSDEGCPEGKLVESDHGASCFFFTPVSRNDGKRRRSLQNEK